jgi:hypothetical protein
MTAATPILISKKQMQCPGFCNLDPDTCNGAAVCASLLPRYQRIGSGISDKLVPIHPPACCKRLVWQGPIAILIPDT